MRVDQDLLFGTARCETRREAGTQQWT